MKRNATTFLRLWLLLVVIQFAQAGESLPESREFALELDARSSLITSLKHKGDFDRVEFIRPGSVLGKVELRVRTPGEPWNEIREGTNGIAVNSRFHTAGASLFWDVTVKNDGNRSIEIGDLALPLPMNTDYTWDRDETFVRRVFKHAFIAGNGSFLYWLPVKGTGSFLVMQPAEGTSLEFFTDTKSDYAHGKGCFTVFVHSRASAEMDRRGTWRQDRTSRVLNPGEIATYHFSFRWSDSYEGVRDLLYHNGGVDVSVAPGMVIPRDLTAMIALRTKWQAVKILPEFPAKTEVQYMGDRGGDTHVYKVKFNRLGENRLTVRDSKGWSMPLEYFVTEPLETLIRKRAAFIVKNQQHRDPTKWYDGLFSLWDRRQPEGQGLLGPDHLGGQNMYAVSGSDDPSNGKCLLVAEKNVAFPDATEIAALEYFVKHFVWGKQQRTDTETPYPFGIYGSDSWKQNRFTDRDPLGQGVSRPGGPSACHMWRTFDYTTYFALYFDLYRIAKQRPNLVKELDAAGYLERAYGTARAYFEVPANIRMDGGWAHKGWVYWQYTTGNFHEKYLLPLIAALEAEGQQTKADFLRSEWEKKVKYFIYDNPWPFASEMPIDSTAYESTYAAARYALERGLKPDTNLWRDRNLDTWFSHPSIDVKRHEEFLLRQHWANLACRGVLEANYWSLGSDFRGCGSASYMLSYMSQMGGWSVLDYALRFDPNPAANLRLGYASMLSSWALMNAGDASSNYGFWTPGRQQDGAMSWGFQPRQVGTEWCPTTRDLPRGAWPVCGEVDHGLVTGIESACTVLFNDPLFGMIAYGGEAHERGNEIHVIPRDGVRQRFEVVTGDRRLRLLLDRDGFAREKPIMLSRQMNEFAFTLESRSPQSHETALTIAGLPTGNYVARAGGDSKRFHMVGEASTTISLQSPGAQSVDVRIERDTEAKVQTAKARTKQPPNILFIYLDDLGYGDVSCLNPQSKISTPNIDRLAKEGMSFTDAHTPAPICGPSRYGLLTGQYPWRSGAGGVDNGQTFDELRIKPDRSTIAKMLRNHGYNTAQMGKWGLRENYSAARREGVETMVDKTSFDFIHNRLLGANLCGFDYAWSIPHLSAEKNDKYVFENGRPTGVNYSPVLEKHGKANPPFQPIRKYEDVLPDNTGAVIEYLDVYAGVKDRPELKLDRQKPFFVYWDPPSPHEPIVPNRGFIGKTEAGDYGDFVFEIDHCIGRVLEVLKKNGLEENTIIVVSSDNGPENLAYERIKKYRHYSMGALRGLKRDSWEGGTRVPFIVKWSGKIAPGSVCKTPIGVIDTFSTIAEITGITLGEQDAPDSISFLPLLLGQNPKRGRPPMIYHTSANMAIREGDWVYFEKTGMGSVEPGWFREERGVKSFVKEGPELFNLKTDPQQLINLASELPERVNALKAELERVKKAGRIR